MNFQRQIFIIFPTKRTENCTRKHKRLRNKSQTIQNENSPNDFVLFGMDKQKKTKMKEANIKKLNKKYMNEDGVERKSKYMKD